MAVNPKNVDLTNVEDVTDIEPRPTIAVNDTEHYLGSIGGVGKRLLLELLDETSDTDEIEDRVFDRLGEDFSHAEWEDYDLYWAEDEDAFVEALEEWNQQQSMG